MEPTTGGVPFLSRGVMTDCTIRWNRVGSMMFLMGSPLARDDKEIGRRNKPPPISLPANGLRGLAVNLGFDGLLTPNVHLDLLGLGFGLLRKINLQHALVIVGTHLPRIYRTGQRERPGELSVLPLDATEVLLFLFLLDPALAMNCEDVVLDANINVFFVDARDFHLQSNLVLVFVDVHRRCVAGGG
jgi:hypothetical protein